MTDAVEEVLQRAFDAVQMSTPLSDVITRGRALQRRRRLARGGIIAAAAVVVVLVIPLVLAGGRTPRAFAGWRAAPTPLTGAEASAAADTCRRVVGSPDNLGSPYLPASVPLLVADGRGPFRFVVLSDDRQYGDCLGVTSPGGGEAVARGPSPVIHRNAVATGSADLAVENSQFLNFGGTYRTDDGTWHKQASGQAAALWGWTSPAVAAVHILVNGEEVDATVAAGVYAAWWPATGSRMPALTIQAFDQRGALISTLHQPAGPCATPTCP